MIGYYVLTYFPNGLVPKTCKVHVINKNMIPFRSIYCLKDFFFRNECPVRKLLLQNTMSRDYITVRTINNS